MKHLLCAIGVLATALGAADARTPASLPPAIRYKNCLSLAAIQPRQAMDMADRWIATHGGAPARHCRAVALLKMGRAADAAHLLEQIADDRTEPTTEQLRADLLGQAGNAWLVADRPEAARRALTRALARRPESPDFLIDRGIAYASLKDYWLALADLGRALKHDPNRIEALLFRAKVYRWLGEPDLAYADAQSALAIHPNQPEALLEAGIALRLKGDRDGARRAWQTLIETAPDSPMTDLAKKDLADLDKADQPRNGQSERGGS